MGSVLLIAAAHTKPLRPLLAWLSPGSAVCPAIGNLSPQDIETQRALSMQGLKGEVPAKVPAAGPFVMGVSMRAEVVAWAQQASVTCTDALSSTALRCTSVPSRALSTREGAPAGGDTFLRFDPQDKLVGVDVMRDEADVDVSVALMNEIVARIERDVGARTATRGALDARAFAAGQPRAAVEFRFTDCAVDVSASRLGASGIVVREQYRWLGKK